MNDENAGVGGLHIIDDGDAQAAPLAPVAPIAMEQPADATPVAAGSSGGAHARVLIIGSGPAGLTAAIYAARADLEPMVIAGFVPGGQLMITSEVENFPGFPDGIDGPVLMANMRAQAERFGARLHDVDVESVDFSERPFTVTAGGRRYTADAVIVATGASAIWLELENETRLRGRGVSACATCDGFFFRDKPVAVVGGGDSALEEALFLTKFASEVVIIHRRDEFRGSRIMQNRAMNHEKIRIEWNTQVTDVLGEDKIEGLELTDTQTGEKRRMDIEGLFVAIGHKPNTDVFREYLDIDEKGYLQVADHTRSNVEGVFVAGDVHDHRYRQAVTAAGDGCRAAIDAERWLEDQAESEATPQVAGEAVSLA
ncbi:MAG: thioredoxin-disulfide reductase [Candidatus Limnocylindrales bacterium]